MKKTLWTLLSVALVALLAAGCAKESALQDLEGRVDSLESRVDDLEDAVKNLNEQVIPNLQRLVTALNNQVTVSSVVKGDNGTYTITFSDGTSAVIKDGKDGVDGKDGKDGVDGKDGKDGKDGADGKDGKDGADGKDGKDGTNGTNGTDGTTPTVDVTLVDGVWVWVINGQVVTDEEGNPIPVIGPKGEDGTNGTDGKDGITPKFAIMADPNATDPATAQNYWMVSYDNGESWNYVGLADAGNFISAYLDPEQETEEYIVLVVGETQVQIPKEKTFTLVVALDENNGVDLDATAEFAYTVEGVSATDEVSVDVIGIIGGWEAEVVPTDNHSGVIKVTNKNDGVAKITVYAANHKGKTDIRTLLFEGGVLEAVIETQDIPANGGEMYLAVTTNKAYKVEIPEAAQDWISVAPDTRARVDNLVLQIAENTTGAYRSATVKVVEEATGESVKDIEVFQYPDPELTTDLASVVAVADGTNVTVYNVTAVAANATQAIITDGESKIYVNAEGLYNGVFTLTGIKGTDAFGGTYIDVTAVAFDTEAEPIAVDEHENYVYYGYGQNGYRNFWTVDNGTISEEEGVYYVTAYADPQRFVISSVPEGLDLESLVGKFVAIKGWVINVDTTDGKEDFNFIPTSVREVAYEVEEGWELAYEGETSGESDYPEQVSNTVANPSEDSYYEFAVYKASALEEYDTIEDFVANVAFNTSDDLLFNLTRYASYGFDYVFSIFAHNDTAADAFAAFDYGDYFLFAIGLDGDGAISGKYAVKEFSKVSPYAANTYEDYLGQWTFTNSAGVEEVWNLVEKVNGESYTVEGLAGITSADQLGGGELAEMTFDATTGLVTLSNQTLGEDWTNANDAVCHDKFVAVWFSGSSAYSNENYMSDPKILSFGLAEDGSVDLMVASDDYGVLEGYEYLYDIPSANQFDRYATAVKLDGAKLVKGIVEDTTSYEQYLGYWKVGHVIWNVEEKVAGETYSVTGIAGQDGFPAVEAVFNNGKFSISEALLDTDSEGTEYYLTGIFAYGTGSYLAYPYNGGPDVLFIGSLQEDGTVNMVAGSGQYATFTSFLFIKKGESGNTQSATTTLPNTMVPYDPSTEDNSEFVTAEYADFLGNWTADDGTVLTITAKEEGSTYEIAGISGGNYYGDPIVAVFEDGAFTITEQKGRTWENTKYGECTDIIQGVFAYGSGEYGYLYFNGAKDGSDPQLICTVNLRASGNLAITAGSCPHGAFVGLRNAWVITNTENESFGNGNSGATFYLDTALKPASAASAPAKAAGKVKSSVKVNAKDVVAEPALSTSSNLPSLVKTQIQRSAAPKTQATAARANGIAAARLAK